MYSLCRGSQLNQSLGMEGTGLSLPIGQGLGWRNVPAGDTKTLLLLAQTC